MTPDFENSEELLEFIEIHGPHSGENMAEVLLTTLEELQIAPKLLKIARDNAGNNGTLCDYLHAELLRQYDDEDDRFRMKPLMRFRCRHSFIPCLAHVINIICKDVLGAFKAGSAREAKVILDELAAQKDQASPIVRREQLSKSAFWFCGLLAARSTVKSGERCLLPSMSAMMLTPGGTRSTP